MVKAAQEPVYVMRFEMSLHIWKIAIYIFMTSNVAALTYFLNDGNSQIAEIQRIEAVGSKKRLTDISRCDKKPCVKVGTSSKSGDIDNTYIIIRK